MLQRKLIYASIVLLVIFGSSYSLRAQVNMQTGSAVFSIPMFNWQDDKSRLASNVALSYNSGNGLKVNDVASNVGQGWQLVAGGVISRMQVGEPDDQPAHLGSLSLSQPNQKEVDHDISKYPAGWLYAPVPPANGCPEALTKYPIYGAQNELYAPFNVTAEDKQLDYFAFNFNGKAGLFILDPENGGTGQSLGDSKMKITYQVDPTMPAQGYRTTIISFTIQDVDGLIYKFAKYGYAQVLHEDFCDPAVTQALKQPTFGTGAIYNQAGFVDPVVDNPKVINSWYLTEVDDPLTLRNIQYSYCDRTVNNTAGADISYNQPKGYFIVSHKTSITTTPELSYIIYPDKHRVDFRYALNDRVDLKGEKALAAVDISYNPPDGTSRILSEYQLNTTYSILNRYGTPVTDYQKSVARLCLRSVKKLGVDLKADSPPYLFDYFLGSNGQEDFVPPPFFYAKDIWGYYNGNNSQDVDGHPVPLNLTVSQLTNVMLEGLCFFRRPTVNDPPALNLLNPKSGFAKNGLLKQVVYPTGGTLSYQYDQNTGVLVSGGSSTMVGGVHVISTSSTDGGYSNGCSNAIVTNYKDVLSDETSSSLWGLEMPVNVIKSKSHYNAEQLKWHISWSCPTSCCYYKYAYPGILSQSEAVDLLGWQKFMESIQPYLAILTVITDIMDIVTVAGGATGFPAIAAVIVDYIGAVLTFGLSCFSGDHDTDENNQVFYNADLNGASPLPTQFKRVEIVEGSGTMGKTVQEFTDDSYYGIWIPTNSDFSARQRFAPWAYGLPRFMTQYDVSGNKIKQIENVYTTTIDSLYQGFYNVKSGLWSGPPLLSCKCTVNNISSQNSTDWTDPTKYDQVYFANSNPNDHSGPVTVDMYKMFTGRTELNTTYERVYRVNDPLQFVETVTTYQYDDQNFQVNSTTTTQSDGKQLTKSITYPDSYQPSTTNAELNNLYHNNILNEPVSISQSVGNMIDEKVTVYTTLTSGNIRPGKILQQRFAQPTPAAVYSPDDNTNSTKYKTVQAFTYSNDVHSNLVGMQDEGGRSVANIYDYNDKYIVASVVNADPLGDAPAYTSFETGSLGGWILTGSAATGMGAMTGKQSFALSSGNSLAAPINAAKSYTVSLWATNAVSVNGGIVPIKSAPIINGFTYYEYIIPAGSSSAVISGNATIDELRLYPQAARMKTTTYDPLIGKTSECDENNRITYYEYDNLGRLKFVKDENHYALKMYEYNNVSPAKQNGCPGMYSNGLVSEVFTRSNCGAGYLGGPATYTVPAGRYSSLLSQADADALAETDVLTNGQGNADATGSCQLLFYNDAQSTQYVTQTCDIGYKGNPVTYSVPAGKYSSTVDKATANQMALDEIAANGQAYANSLQGMSCSIDTGPDWESQDGDPFYCQTVNGVLPAHEFRLATDMNPNSSTYNQTQYMDMGAQNACPAGTYFNAARSQTFTRNNCVSGYAPGNATYSVPPGGYSSTASQAAADQLAIDDINANGQNYANTNGTCTLTSTVYAKLGLENVNVSAGTADVVVRFFSDAACTISTSATNITVNVTQELNCIAHQSENNTSTSAFPATGPGFTGSVYVLFTHINTSYNDPLSNCLPNQLCPKCSQIFNLVSGTGYIVEQ